MPRWRFQSKNWWIPYYPFSILLFPVERGRGSRQNFTTATTGAVYEYKILCRVFGRDQSLTANNKNILQKDLFIILPTSKMIALSRVYAIFHIAICLPMQYLAGVCHQLVDQGFSFRFRSMSQTVFYLDEKQRV